MHRSSGFLFVLGLGLLLGAALEARSDPPSAACTHAPAHLSTFTPNCTLFDCDVMIDPTGTLVPPFAGVRIGDPLGAPGDEQPRFFFDEAGNRFHTEIFSRFLNNGGETVPSGRVTVHFSVKPNATGPTDTSGTFTAIGDYVMDIPGADPLDRLYPTSFHLQPLAKPVCWILAPGTLFPKQFMLKVELDWSDDEDSSNDTLFQFYDLTAEARPADIAFSLDLSGSMGISIPSVGSRLAVAQDRARMFIDLIEEGEGNRLGVFGFATGMPAGVKSDFTATWKSNATTSHAAVLGDSAEIFPFRTVATAADRLAGRVAVSDPTVVKPYGCTPVGQGLLRAKKGLLDLTATPGEERNRAIVLFSDGFQNVAPFVNATPPWTCGAPGSLALIHAEETFKNNTPTLPIYSVFFGEESGWAHQLMVDIQDQTGGEYLYYTGTSLELAAAYYQIRHLVAANAMLLLVEDGQVTAPAPGPAYPVHFDAAAGAATVAVAWPVGSQGTLLTVEARPLGAGPQAWQDLGQLPADTPPPGTVGRPTGSRFNDAHRVFRFSPGPGSAWEVRVRQLAPDGGSTPYALGVFARTEEVRLKASLGARGFAAGKTLPIYADLRSAGHPVPGAEVRAAVLAPARPFSTTLRRYADRLQLDPGRGDQAVPGLAGQLSALLAREVGSPELYPVRQLEVTLNDRGQGADQRSGDGVYTGELGEAETTVAGNYDVTVTARGTLQPSGVAFERSEKLGAVAAIGPIDPARSEVRFSDPQPLDGGQRAVTVTVLATDRFGNATFPGARGAIALTAQPGGGSLAGALADNLDSTYTQTLLLAPGEEPRVRLQVGGTDFGVVAPGRPEEPSARLEASFHLGLAQPHGRLARGLDAGPAFALDATWRLNPRFALRGELGVSLFDDPSGGDRRLTHLVPYLQFRNPGPVWQPYFETGFGLYDLQGAGTAGGFSAGVGVQRWLAPRWRLDLALHGHHAGGSLDATYSQLKIGFQVIF